jgi:vancomycin aglycone glucosyltransferase
MKLTQVGSFHGTAGALSPELERFIDGGTPPVYVGFGSMRDGSPDDTTRLVLEAARAADVRVVIGGGWARLGRVLLPPTAFAADHLNHGALFPRVAGIVHHGGAGTTAAATRAGKPQLVVPHLFDQHYYGARVAEVGLGPPPVSRPQLTTLLLSNAFRTFLKDDAIRARAAALGERLRRHDAVGAAVDAIVSAARARGRLTPERNQHAYA